jgi:hypothetical protein
MSQKTAPDEIRFLLCVDDSGRLYMLGRCEINEPFLARIVHDDDDDAGLILDGLSVGDGCGPWSAGDFDFFGDADPQWVGHCARSAAAQLAEWSRGGRLMRIQEAK